MIVNSFKNLVADLFRFFGYSIHKKYPKKPPERKTLTFEYDISPSSSNRPIGDMNTFFNDLRERGFDGNIILDVGSNVTDWSMMAAKTFPKAKFYLIDPLIEMKPHLESFCKKYPGSEYIITGVGSKNEKLILTIWGNFLESSTFVISENETFRESNKQREVEVVTIDHLIESGKIKIPDFVKIDIQGFELEALKGAGKLFGSTELFVIEVSLFQFNELTPAVSEIINYMNEKNYVIYDIIGFNRRPYDGALAQLDICFVKKDSFLKKSNVWEKEN